MVDILRHLPPNVRVEFWRVNSYRERHSTGKVTGLKNCFGDFSRHDVLIVDDILDTGLTLSAVQERVRKLGAKRIDICVLLRKNKIRRKVVEPRWIGFDIEDEFVVGYGLDFDGKFRALPNIHTWIG